MAVTLFHKVKIKIKNKVVINNNKEEPKTPQNEELNIGVRGKMYGRRTINK